MLWSCTNSNLSTEEKISNLNRQEIEEEREVELSIPEEVKIENKSMIIKDLINKKKFNELGKIYADKAKLIDDRGVRHEGFSEVVKYWTNGNFTFVEQVIEEIVVKNGIAYEYGQFELGNSSDKRNYLNIWEFDNDSNQWKITLDFRQ